MPDKALPRRHMADIAEALRAAKDRGGKCTLLIGAGCSLSAGIPLAGKIIDDIRDTYAQAYKRAKDKSDPPGYSQCMKELSPGVRRDLLKGYIDKARINWAHIGIAQLVKYGYVDRILTTNFDPLVMRACALVNQFPAVYDLTAIRELRQEDLPDQAIFHLHGQRNGFTLLNESLELARHSESLKPILAHARESRVWIVAGYSGENDPLFNLIREVNRYEYDLFWVDIKADPASGIADFFDEERQTFYVQDARGADQFFMELASQVEAWPPVFLDQPFEHLREQLATIVKPDPASQEVGIDWLKQARDKIDRAETSLKADASAAPEEDVGKVQATLLQQGAEQAIAASQTPDMKAALLFDEALADHLKADALQATDLPAARALWQQAGERYAQALAIKQDDHHAANNWGSALDHEAQALAATDLPTARALWQQAGERYAQALAIKPDKHVAANNWGGAYVREYQAIKSAYPDEAPALLIAAENILRKGEETKPGSCAYNLACVAALKGNLKSCLDWLETRRQHGQLLTAQHIREDRDFDGIRQDPAFVAWWQKTFGPAAP